MSDFQVLGVAGAVLSVIGLAAITVGVYLEYDRVPSHTPVGKVAQVLGWAGWLAISVVNSRVATRGLGDASGYGWSDAVGSILLNCVWGACAHALGWLAAKLIRRSV